MNPSFWLGDCWGFEGEALILGFFLGFEDEALMSIGGFLVFEDEALISVGGWGIHASHLDPCAISHVPLAGRPGRNPNLLQQILDEDHPDFLTGQHEVRETCGQSKRVHC